MFIYQEQPNSKLLVIQLDLGEYVMTYHHMEQNGCEIIAFTQNRLPNNDERAYLDQWTAQQYEQHRVMNLFRDSFQNCMNLGELQINHVHT